MNKYMDFPKNKPGNYIELPMCGLEGPMSEMERALQDNVHRFAAEVLRPVAAKLDRLSAEEMIAPGSELWTVLEKSKELGLSLVEMEELEPLERARLLAVAIEELSWGCPGLTGAILVTFFPTMFSLLAGNMAMAKYCEGRLGCWAITEPDHGTDMLDSHGQNASAEGSYGRPNCVARIEGDKVVINGQKSAWVSGATYAEVCVLYTHVEQNGVSGPGIAIIVDLDSAGVSKGKPLEKMGLRGLNQGEIFFDNVEVPLSHVIAGPEKYGEFVTATLTEANPHVGAMVMGAARAAYEYALAYAHERKAGGVPLIQHQHVRYRLFHMFRKVEMARAMLHRVITFNATAPEPALHASAAAKVSVTQIAFEVANEALQIFGGNGMTREYPLEKLVRDTRACLIADGCNEFLAIKGGTQLINPELL
jgi:alkylation response protein AidB-like acyl-CoA dehydrogenase